jgi:hypothetical protein
MLLRRSAWMVLSSPNADTLLQRWFEGFAFLSKVDGHALGSVPLHSHRQYERKSHSGLSESTSPTLLGLL